LKWNLEGKLKLADDIRRDMIREPLHLPKITYASDKGVIKTPGRDVPITNISAYLSRAGDIIIEGTIDARHPEDIHNCDIVFQDDSGWDIIGKNFSIFEEKITVQAGADLSSLYANFKAMGLKLIGKRGKISSTDRVNIYKFVTDINFAGDVRIPGLSEFGVKFNTDGLKDLMLIKSNTPEIPRSVGYFEVADTYSKYDTTWTEIFDNLLLLFKFAASNVINFPVTFISNSQGDELIELTPYVNEGGSGRSIFYLSYPGALSELVDSTFASLVSLREALDLDRLILNYIMMKNIRYAEIGYLQGCVFMGGLSYSFAKNIMEYKHEGDKILKSDGSSYSFRELIEELYAYFDIKSKDMDFIRYRDEILNQGGISSITFEGILMNKAKLESVIEHLLLNILHFKGYYWDRPSKQWVKYNSEIA
jgi:hypothetical protein